MATKSQTRGSTAGLGSKGASEIDSKCWTTVEHYARAATKLDKGTLGWGIGKLSSHIEPKHTSSPTYPNRLCKQQKMAPEKILDVTINYKTQGRVLSVWYGKGHSCEANPYSKELSRAWGLCHRRVPPFASWTSLGRTR